MSCFGIADVNYFKICHFCGYRNENWNPSDKIKDDFTDNIIKFEEAKKAKEEETNQNK